MDKYIDNPIEKDAFDMIVSNLLKLKKSDLFKLEIS